MSKKVIWVNLTILTFFILDRIAKKLFLKGILVYKKIGPFNFYLYKNYKMILGIPFANIFLRIVICLIVVFLIYKLKKAYLQKEVVPLIALTLIIVGAISNILDQFVDGFVVDYINLGPWSIFNLADLMIWLGIAILIVKYFKIRSAVLKQQ